MEVNNDFQSDENIETILDVDSIEDHDTLLYNNYDNMSETSSQYDLPQYSLDNESLMIVEEDEDIDDDDDDDDDDNDNHVDSISDISNNGNVEAKKPKNEPFFIKIPDQKMFANDKNEDNAEIKISDQQVPIKRNIMSAVVMNPNNTKTPMRQKNNSLNLETIAIPKMSTTNVKISSPIISKQLRRTPYIVSTASIMKPTISNERLQSKSNITGLSYNKTYSKPKQELKILPSNESKSKLYVVPCSSVNVLVNASEPRSQSLKSISMSSVINTINTMTDSVDRQKKVYVTSSRVLHDDDDNNDNDKFMRNISNGKFKVLPSRGKVPVDLQNVFKRNSHFVKQKITTVNKCKTNDVLRSGKSANSHQYTKGIRQFQKNQMAAEKSCNKISETLKLSNMNKHKKVIPHTVTSKDALENSKKIVTNTSIQEKRIPSRFIQLPSRSDSSHSGGQKLNIACGKSIHQFLPLDSFNKSKTKVNTSTNSDDVVKVFPNEICKSMDIQINKSTVEHENNMLLTEEFDLEELDSEYDENSGQFIPCHYKYCETLVFEPELIDNLYCSLLCKKSDSKEEIVSEKKPINDKDNLQKHTDLLKQKLINDNLQTHINLSENRPIDRKVLLAKIESRINKRKQLFSPCSRPQKIPRNDWDEIEQFNENSCDQPSIDQSSQNSSSNQSSSPEVVKGDDDVGGEDDDDDNEIFSLKVLKFSTFTNDIKSFKYIQEMRFRSAIKKLFDKPFPDEKNYFKVGQRLEGIDPEHEALFCVMSVVEVRGYRIKLSFDGFSKDYDFWVNADCPDLFFPKWCEQNTRTLQPPRQYEKTFDWDTYINEIDATLAPKQNFAIFKNLGSCIDHKFRVGAKLEALDKLTRTLPKQLICVATVADILYNRVRIHFDGWTEDFDYWTDVTSTNIHPVGWCESNGRSLSPPSGYNDFKGKKPFSWTEYLKETNSEPVPEEAFVRRPLRDFANKMTIEVVDLVVPSLIRIAEIIDVRGDELKILYDGFHISYAYWVEDDSPDIHPVGWSLKTNHPIEVPPTKHTLMDCKVMGCNGKGNTNDSSTFEHTAVKDCPYEMDSWKIAVAGLGKLPDRLKSEKILPNIVSAVTSIKSESIENEDEKKVKSKLNVTVNNSSKPKGKIAHKSNGQLNMKHIEPECSSNITNVRVKQRIKSMNNDELRNAIGSSLVLNNSRKFTLGKQDTSWLKNNAQLDLPLFMTTNALKWSADEVASYVKQITSINYTLIKNTDRISNIFIDQEIDGESFLILSQSELLNVLKIPLGHALKIHNAIMMLRRRVPIFNFVETMNCTKKKE